MFILNYYNKQRRSFKKWSQLLLANDELDPEVIHKLRVCSRRLRAIFWVLKHDYKHQKHLGLERLQDEVRVLGHRLGARRQLDVLTQVAETYHADTSTFAAERKRAGKRLVTLLRTKRRGITRQLKQLSLSLEQHPPRARRRPDDHLSEDLLAWSSSRPTTEEDLHKLRIFVKKLRYILEARHVKPADIILQFQELLGEYHDLTVFKAKLPRKRQVASDAAACLRKIRALEGKALRAMARGIGKS